MLLLVVKICQRSTVESQELFQLAHDGGENLRAEGRDLASEIDAFWMCKVALKYPRPCTFGIFHDHHGVQNVSFLKNVTDDHNYWI